MMSHGRRSTAETSNAFDVAIDAQQPRAALQWSELWRYRELLLVFIQRDIAVRYQQTALGILWAVLQPLGMVAIFSVVFGRFTRVAEEVAVPYPLFAFAGMLPWMFFASALNSAGQSVLGARGLISKVYFPRLIIPVSAVGAPLLDLACSTVIMAALMAFYQVPIGWSLLAMPFLILLLAITAIGFGSLTAALVVLYRDARHLLPFIISGWLFLTPVIYPPGLLPAEWHWLLYLNPVAGIVDGMRSAWFGHPFDSGMLSASVAVTACVFYVGVRYFHAVEREFADVL